MKMRVVLFALVALLGAGEASAAWYWPFGGGTNDVDEAEPPRLSELMEPASLAIDEATDLVNDGKTDEAVEKYREALRILERLEVENPERAATPEFQSVRNKRAYVDAQLNAILLEEARLNAKAVAVTDTTDLEEKLRKKRAAEKARAKDPKEDAAAPKDRPKLESELGDYMKGARDRAKTINRAAASVKFERESEEKIRELLEDDPESRKARIMRAGLELYRKNYGTAKKDVDALLAKDPDDVAALNLKAAIDIASGDAQAAEDALVRAINAKRSDYHAYYNLAKLLIQRGGEKNAERAKTLYRAGRKSKGKGGPGGPKDPYLEKTLEEKSE